MIQMIRCFPIAFILLLASVSYGAAVAQETGTLSGKVWDEVTGEELVGANILLVGTPRGGTTDLNGKFSVRGIPVGTYDVRITYVGYTTKLVRGLQIVAGEQEPLQITLQAEQVEAEEVVITAERLLSTESAVLANRQKAVSIGDGLSAEQIKKAPDATSAGLSDGARVRLPRWSLRKTPGLPRKFSVTRRGTVDEEGHDRRGLLHVCFHDTFVDVHVVVVRPRPVVQRVLDELKSRQSYLVE